MLLSLETTHHPATDLALSRVFGSGLNGHCRERPEVAQTAIPLVARHPAVACRGREFTR
ncbi:MAG: hypothetical protein CO108_22240 [Deltaproteobacteria bacterium CG_4_9_14_3_um_filter_63_12]|nr:MAG: hypothetical protein COW42_01660 [Deltaproteobacteria bacterium CG17_big_fil_post_rev_8_21_14_2_50_63_7]PJB36900.1 MAG: hypothetical protein CO108_22240 [Deltaproteobacteria bacterium CG_4_9_14_3_um_filter_63_12]